MAVRFVRCEQPRLLVTPKSETGADYASDSDPRRPCGYAPPPTMYARASHPPSCRRLLCAKQVTSNLGEGLGDGSPYLQRARRQSIKPISADLRRVKCKTVGS
jgi:hypothetical protein